MVFILTYPVFVIWFYRKLPNELHFNFMKLAFGDSPHQRFRSKKIFYIVSIVVDFETIEGSEPERMYN